MAESPTAPTPSVESSGPKDLQWGAFSTDAPWIVERDELRWRGTVPALRRAVAAELPRLTIPGRLPPGLRIVATSRRLGSALMLWRLTRRSKSVSDSRRDLARRLRVAAENLGPTYIKLGQIISSGQGIFPPELVEEFALCRDRVPPEPFALIRSVVEEDLGQPLDEVFSFFDRKPLAAASIAQVHRATLRTGEDVVVKVQRPSVATRVRDDLRVMAWLAPFLVGRIPVAALANPPAFVDLFAETITEELDFRLEADNMLDVAASLVSLDQRGYVIPRPHPELVTRRVLVMERLSGFAFDDASGMQAAGIDTEQIVKTGMVMFLEGAMFNGVFHGDLHSGNLLVLPDGRTGLLDFGITARLSDLERNAFLRLLVSASMNDVKGQLKALTDLGALPRGTDLDAVITDLDLDKPPIDPMSLTPDELTGEIQRVVKALLGYGAQMPKPLMLFVKNLVFLDGAITTLAPDLDLVGEITHIALYFTQQHGQRIAEEAGLAEGAWQLDLSGVEASFGSHEDGTRLTHRDIRRRRKQFGIEMEKRAAERRRGRRRR